MDSIIPLNKFICAFEVHDTGKTKVYDIKNTENDLLGKVCWYPNWRRYTFWPDDKTIFDVKCLKAISDFVDKLMKERNGK